MTAPMVVDASTLDLAVNYNRCSEMSGPEEDVEIGELGHFIG